MRHLPFLTALARHQDECVAWRAESAGYMVLRLFDHWVEAGGIAEMMPQMQRVRTAIDKLHTWDAPTHERLAAILTRMEQADTNAPATVAPAFLAYGRHLETMAGQPLLAADVVQTLAMALVGAANVQRARRLAR